MKQSEALALRKIIEQAMNGEIDDATALEAVSLFAEWNPESNYKAGERVRYKGVLYRSLQDHLAQAGWTPTAAPSLWARVLIEDPNVIPDWVQPGSTNPHQIGDQVRHKGHIWECIVPNNVWEPGVYGWVTIDD